MASAKKGKMVTDLELFDEVFTQIVDDLTKAGLQDKEIGDSMVWFKEVLALSPHVYCFITYKYKKKKFVNYFLALLLKNRLFSNKNLFSDPFFIELLG